MENTNIIGVIAIVALLLGVASVGAIYTGYIKGERGDQGIIGQVGPMGNEGPKGDVGDMPTHEWNGTCIRFELPDGTWSDWIDLKGEEGDRGPTGHTGPVGAKGEDGEDGIDLEPNEAPRVALWVADSYIEGCGNLDDYVFCLNATVKDLENDLMHLNIYYKMHENDSWIFLEGVPMVSNNTTLSFSKEIDGNWYWGDKTIYWLAEVMDGENLVYKQEECTLTKVCL